MEKVMVNLKEEVHKVAEEELDKLMDKMKKSIIAELTPIIETLVDEKLATKD